MVGATLLVALTWAILAGGGGVVASGDGGDGIHADLMGPEIPELNGVPDAPGQAEPAGSGTWQPRGAGSPWRQVDLMGPEIPELSRWVDLMGPEIPELSVVADLMGPGVPELDAEA